ncbi:acyl carrier protein [Paenibacillus kobensis]|uniref:acyl carrier protein n=1 Tax=Paenibacillus kobensis TaxID=59841 RepID=UPI00157FD45A|nr:acyl carrier protein [Paenibacillus kobensis]
MSEKEGVLCRLMSDKGCGVVQEDDIKPDKRLYEIGFDSLRFMELVILIEEELNITLPDEILDLSPVTTVSDIFEIVARMS